MAYAQNSTSGLMRLGVSTLKIAHISVVYEAHFFMMMYRSALPRV